MRDIVSPLMGLRSPFGGRVDQYKAGGFRPTLVADMSKDYYRSTSRQTFDDLFTHSRLGNATMTDSDGLVKWGPHNLLTYSEDFSNAAWSKTNTTVTANAATAPDGTLTADKLVENTATNVHSVTRAIGPGAENTIVVWMKAAERSVGYIRPDFTSTFFDLENGLVVNDGHGTGQISDAGNGWWKCSISTTDTSYNLNIGVSTAGGTLSYTGDGTSGVYIWGAHLYRSDLGGMAPVPPDARVAGSTTYVPTTSTAVYLPRRHNHVYNGTAWVDAGTKIENKARTNLVTYSEDFTDASWVKVGTATLAVDATGPDGETSAVTLVDSGATGSSGVYLRLAATVATSTAYTYSIFAKADQLSWVRLIGNNFTTPSNGGVWFDLANGVVGTEQAGYSGEIEDCGAGWYRCSMTFTTDAVDTGGLLFVALADADGSTSVDLDGTSSILIYGAQLEAGSTPSSYIPTSGSTVTRAADTSGLTIPSSVAPWPTPRVIGDELVTNGTFDADSDWTKGTGWTIGSGVASRTNTGTATTLEQSISFSAGSVYEVTYDITRASGGVTPQFLGGTTVAGAYRNSSGTYTDILVAQTGNVIFRFSASTTFEGTIDNVSVKEIDPLVVAIQMKGRMTISDEDSLYQAEMVRWQLDANNYIKNRARTTTDVNSFRLDSLQAVGGTAHPINMQTSYKAVGVNVPFNIASYHGSTFINGAVDGVALTADTTPTALPDLSSTDLSIGYDFMGNIEQVRIWVGGVTDVTSGNLLIEDASS